MKENKILIVDDEEGIRENLKALLEDDIGVIHTAENGEEALKIYAAHKPFDCIISDINMPVMNGVEFIKRLRAQDDDIPFIFFTAYGTRDLMYEAVKYGAFEFISKPHFDDLLEIIQSAINYKRKETTESKEEDIISEYQNILNSKN